MSRRRQTIVVSILGVMAVALYAGLAALQILVLNPLAAAPGRSIAQIGAEMSAAGETLGAGWVSTILGIGLLIALLVAAVSVRAAAPPKLTAMLFLGVLTLGYSATSRPPSARAWVSPIRMASAAAITLRGRCRSIL